MPYPRINIEETFAELVRNHGGVVLDDVLPKSPDFENADYVFHFEKIIAELKCLTEDNINSENNAIKVTDLVKAWHLDGKIKITNIDESNWREWPNELQNKIFEIKTKSIKRRIQKANVQIRETKRYLKLDDYCGLLVLANDGVFSLPPAAFIHAAMLALRRDFNEIKYFIFLTANVFTQLRESPTPTVFWIAMDMQRGARMDSIFTNRLGSNWRNLVCKKSGIPGFEMEMSDIEGFWNAHNVDLGQRDNLF
ncbi:MAG TPA: hypothetical protein VG733_06150 [Chthoniobacteraceae bacterium]|nr:hypothetical protein [Chthoniobacteraceae bacterium]